MSNDLRIEKLTRQGIALLQEERALALKGDIAGLAELTQRKEAYLQEMEALAAKIEASGPVQVRAAQKREIEGLFDILRRRAEENQYLLKAAADGVRSARGKIDQILSGEMPFSAYSANGERIESKTRRNNTSALF